MMLDFNFPHEMFEMRPKLNGRLIGHTSERVFEIVTARRGKGVVIRLRSPRTTICGASGVCEPIHKESEAVGTAHSFLHEEL